MKNIDISAIFGVDLTYEELKLVVSTTAAPAKFG